MESEQLIQCIADADTNNPRLFAEAVERDYGVLYRNSENLDSYDSNHAVITNPNADVKAAVADIVEFYRSHNQDPRICHGFVDTEEEILIPFLRQMGFEVERNNNQTFVWDPCSIDSLEVPEHPKIKRFHVAENGFSGILRKEDGGDWNVKKWIRCIQNSRIFAFAQPDGNGNIVAIAELCLHESISLIDDVVTEKSNRRRGFATSMMTQIIQFHEDMKSGKPLCLFADNPSAIRVYEKLGFRRLEHNYSLWSAYLD